MPVPPTPVDDADQVLAAALRRHGWVDHEHHVGDNAYAAKAGRAWLAAKGL